MSSKAISFTLKKYNLDEICAFMEESGLFHFLENKNVKNLIDYLTGIEVGLDSNARKNRGGKEMVNKFRQFLNNAKIMFDEEFSTKQITKKYGIIFPENIKKKRFDFVFKINETIYGVEVNFYSGGGSKLNETAKSYIELNKQFKSIKNFKFL
jgi:type II restriction enzyme